MLLQHVDAPAHRHAKLQGIDSDIPPCMHVAIVWLGWAERHQVRQRARTESVSQGDPSICERSADCIQGCSQDCTVICQLLHVRILNFWGETVRIFFFKLSERTMRILDPWRRTIIVFSEIIRENNAFAMTDQALQDLLTWTVTEMMVLG